MTKKSSVTHSMMGSSRGANLEGAQEMLAKLEEQDRKAELEQTTSEVSEEAPPKELGDLKDLIFLGKASRVFEVGGFKFKIETLESAEKKNLLVSIALRGRGEAGANIKHLTMAYAVKTINGVPVEELYEMYGGDLETASNIEKRIYVMSKLQSALVERLFNVYDELVNEAEGAFDSGDIKK